ncbi:MAG: hypothetical protein EBU96_11855 [Actinobacteria bacterium]|nr:hypothetical protein [Actinomycetota bacterium]
MTLGPLKLPISSALPISIPPAVVTLVVFAPKVILFTVCLPSPISNELESVASQASQSTAFAACTWFNANMPPNTSAPVRATLLLATEYLWANSEASLLVGALGDCALFIG